MTQEEKLYRILSWYAEISPEQRGQLIKEENFKAISEIEELVGEPLPKYIRNLLEKYDDVLGSGYGSFFGHSFISLSEIKDSLEFSKTLMKPKIPKVTNPEKSKSFIEKIIQLVVDELPLNKQSDFIKSNWYKVEFESAPDSTGGSYFYPNNYTSDSKREMISLSSRAQKQVLQLTKELHELELQDYNWDNLEFIVYGDGQYNVDRTYYDFDNTLPLTSTPEGAIKKKYFHIKWIPIISDGGGNYIGVDLDPDTNGVKGQVIVFGRDEEDMMVLSNSWDEFLDCNLGLIEKEGDKLKSDQSHLHDMYR